MTDEAQDPAPDLTRKKRQLLTGILAVILLIGVGGTVIALLSSSSDDSTKGLTAPGATIDPLTPEGVCRADKVLTYTVVPDPKAAPAFTATAAAKPWLLKGEGSQTTSVNGKTKLVALAAVGKQPREVLRVEQGKTGWSVTRTSACLTEKNGATSCPDDVSLTLEGTTYVEEFIGNGYTPTQVVGQGSVNPCVDGDQTAYTAQGTIAPVTAYKAKVPDSVDVDLGGGNYRQYGAKK